MGETHRKMFHVDHFGVNMDKKGKTWRAKSLESLRQLYSAGVHATLEGQPETDWENHPKPGTEPKGIKPRQDEENRDTLRDNKKDYGYGG